MSVLAGKPDRIVRTVCSYCGVGCVLDLNVRDDQNGGRVIRVTSNTDRNVYSVNGLHLCVKGRYGYEFIHHPQRQEKPRVRKYLLEGEPRPKGLGPWVDTDWDTAIKLAANGIHHAREQFGADRVAVLASGKNLNEENYLLGKLARQVIGTNHIDCISNLYYSSVVDGLMETVGIPAMSNSLDDIARQANSLLVIGSNLTEQHPVFGTQIRQAILRRKVKMVVASPDFYNIDEYAALTLYHQPKTETALINGLMHILLEKGWEDTAFVQKYPQGFDEFRDSLAMYSPEVVSEITGVQSGDLYKAAEILAQHKPAAVIWSIGLAHHELGRNAVQALANLQMLLGNLGKPGGGVNPLRSQNNIQGACDMGCSPGWLPGYQAIGDPQAREKFELAWGAMISPQPGFSTAQMLLTASQANIKAMYIVGEELINTSEQAAQVRQSLANLDFLVLQEMAASETTRYADVILPGVSFAEKSGSFTSTDRRIQMVRQAIQPLGEARQDWVNITDLANSLLALDGHPVTPGPFSSWDYDSTEQIMQEISALTPIYAGVSHKLLAHNRRVPWPVGGADEEGLSLLPAGYFSDGELRWITAKSITPSQVDR